MEAQLVFTWKEWELAENQTLPRLQVGHFEPSYGNRRSLGNSEFAWNSANVEDFHQPGQN
jgi:hypothetical protein